MKKLIALLSLLAVSLPLHAQIGSQEVWPGTQSNVVYRGTSPTFVLNRLQASATFASAANTNTAFLVTNNVVAVPTSAFLMTVSAWGSTSAITNSYVLSRSTDKHTWAVFTNVSVIRPQTNTARSTVEITTLGNYPYVQLTDVTNASSGAALSNYVSFHWK